MVKNPGMLLSLLSVMLLSACSSIKAAEPIIPPQAVTSLQVIGGLHGSKNSPLYLPLDSTGTNVINKVVGWINHSPSVRDETLMEKHGYPKILRIVTKDGNHLDAEPAYHCESKKLDDYRTLKTCTNIGGEVLLSSGSGRLRLHSQALYDWLIEGWKQE
ncbi:hypothetical protein ACFPYJ_03660 [Paenibacillus solisilvae]|uniref:DUF4362 domain-containing protein n=1 Tax=Paenibacillus solisilvae TaxID=2486751 RepID=A0ABW0VQQ5_9BACL